MKNNIYARFARDHLILRDELAIDRTLMANERTLLAYLRSAVALIIAGVSIIHFSQHIWFWAIGLFCLPLGILTGIIGVARFRRMNDAIALIRKINMSSGDSLPQDASLPQSPPLRNDPL